MGCLLGVIATIEWHKDRITDRQAFSDVFGPGRLFMRVPKRQVTQVN